MASETASAGPLHAAIEAQFLRAMGRGAEVVETPAFRIHLWPRPDPFYRAVAVPIRRPDDWPPAILAMQAAFQAAGLPPRLEVIEERWPDLAPALAAAGFAEGARQWLMVATAPPPAPPPTATDGLSADPPVRLLPAAPPVIERYLVAVHEAFAQHADRRTLATEAKQLARAIRAGSGRIAVVTTEAGRIVAGAGLIGIVDDAAAGPRRIAELAGVWTAPDEGGRGLATRVAGSLLDGFLGRDQAAGEALVWLAAEGDRATELYARLGFRPIGWQRNYSAAAA